MTDKLNFSDLDSCCNTCSDKTKEKDVETNTQKLKIMAVLVLRELIMKDLQN